MINDKDTDKDIDLVQNKTCQQRRREKYEKTIERKKKKMIP